MKRVLFISSFIGVKKTGGAILSQQNLSLSKKIFGDDKVYAYSFLYNEKPLQNDEIIYLPSHTSKKQTLTNYILGYAGGLNTENFNTLKALVSKNEYDYIFLDGSLLGKLAKEAKRINPAIKITTFFHNVERDFFLKSLQHKPEYILLWNSVCKNERYAAKYSDYLIALSERDAQRIKKIYTRKVSATVPCYVEDLYEEKSVGHKTKNNLQLLFTGSDFFANVEGLKWFVKKVMPKVTAHLTVIGRGMEKYKQELSSNKVTIEGTVEQTAKFYSLADIVVAPVLSGSGMKLKVAEGLMFGKTIIGTPEAWQGYDVVHGINGYVADSASSFIECINNVSQNKIIDCNKNARQLYLDKYSPKAAENKIEELRKLFLKS